MSQQGLKRIFGKQLLPKKYRIPIIALVTLLWVVIIALVYHPRVPLEVYEASVYSQNGEDGVLQKIFEVIKPTQFYAVEFGGGDGIRLSNIRNLIVHHGWNGLFMEGDADLARMSAEAYKDYPNVKSVHAWVYPGNIELLLEENEVPKDLDLLVIDIDSNDWYVWRAIHDFRPKVVQIEYNPIFPPPYKMVLDFHPMTYWDHTIYYGASIQSLYELGKKKGYELVYAESNAINLIFVDQKYFKRFGIKDNSPAALYPANNEHLSAFTLPLRAYAYLSEAQITEIGKDGKPPAPFDQDLVWDSFRIKKRFRFDR